MARARAALLYLVLASAPAWADVTVTYTTTGKGLMGMAGTFETTTSIKGHKMRSEATVGGDPVITILDADTQQMISINPKKKEAEIIDLVKLNAEMAEKVGTAEAQVSVTPNGETRQVLGQSCAGYTVRITMPMNMAQGMSMTMQMGGPMFLAAGAPGSADFSAFYRAAAERGLVFTSAQQAEAQPVQAKGMAEMYRAIADLDGIPYEQVIDISMQGAGPMAAMMSRMGGASMTITATAVSTDALSDDLFTIPAEFKVKNR